LWLRDKWKEDNHNGRTGHQMKSAEVWRRRRFVRRYVLRAKKKPAKQR
jgi:hypothetical protein